MLTDFEALLPGVMTHVAACPEPTAISAIRSAIRVLCQECRVWSMHEQLQLSSDAEGPEIIISPPEALIFDLRHVILSGQKMKIVSPQEWEERWPDWQNMDGNIGYYCTQFQPNTLVLGIKDRPAQLNFRAFVMPSLTGESVPEYIIQKYGSDIIHGALSSLLVMPNVAWTNTALGGYHAGLWKQARNLNFASEMRGQIGGLKRPRPSYY